MSQRLTHDVEASMSRAVPPAPDVAVAHLEQGLGCAGAPSARFDKAQAEQTLWQELCDHDASINNALTEALRVHGGPLWQIFQLSVFCRIQGSLSHPLCIRVFSDFTFSCVLNYW
jgi:hypothetical protein